MGRKRPLSALIVSFILSATASVTFAQVQSGNWIGAWGTASYATLASSLGQGNGDFTYRNIVHTSIGGSAIRVQLSNEFGVGVLNIGAAQVGLSAGSGAIQPGTSQTLTFGGSPTVMIPAFGVAYSDPVYLYTPAFTSLAVSLYLPAQTINKATCHPYAIANSYMSTGDTVTSPSGGTAAQTWCYIRGVDVETATAGSTIVAVGDSITDGFESTVDGNKRYTDDLAVALQANPATANISVLNKGLLANELLGIDTFTGYGTAGLGRLNSDVFSQPGVGYVILLEGINDLGYSVPSGTLATADALIAGYQQLIAQAHLHGIKVYAGTITPDGGTGYYTNDDTARQAVNAWIRTCNQFDAVIDFDAALTNGALPPAIPALQKQYDSGDHLHPNVLGYSVMAAQISPTLFEPATSSAKK